MKSRETLADLKDLVRQVVGGAEVVDLSERWAEEQVASWPDGEYSQAELELAYQAGFLRGYLNGGADRADQGD